MKRNSKDMNKIQIDLTKHMGFFGVSGSGKSYKMGWAIEQLHKQKRPFVVFDTKQTNHLGLSMLPGVEHLKIKPGKEYDWRLALKMAKYIVCTPWKETKDDPLIEREELIEQYKQFASVIFNEETPCTLFVEEVHLWNPSANKADVTLNNIIREGRAYGINLILADQRIQSLPKDLWSQCRYSIICKMGIPQDILYLEGFVPDFEKINAALPPYAAVIYDHMTSSLVGGTLTAKHFPRKTIHEIDKQKYLSMVG